MPYVRADMREKYDKNINSLINVFKDNNSEIHGLGIKFKADGEMNYIITKLLNGIYSNFGYSEYSRAIGVLECVKLELYRRKISIYEDQKIKDNGDVY